MRTWFAVAVLLVSLSAEAKTKTKSKAAPKKQDSRTVGLGRSCKKRSECKSRSQVCLKMSDARGKELPKGFCALPCASLDMGLPKTAAPARPSLGADGGVASTTDAGVLSQKDGGLGAVAAAAEAANTRPATAAEIKQAAKRRTASRCPARFQCRSAGAGVPIDLCVKE
ncbi:MAG: hypothetical protein ACJ783_21245 [Myxococcales bacterium]